MDHRQRRIPGFFQNKFKTAPNNGITYAAKYSAARWFAVRWFSVVAMTFCVCGMFPTLRSYGQGQSDMPPMNGTGSGNVVGGVGNGGPSTSEQARQMASQLANQLGNAPGTGGATTPGPGGTISAAGLFDAAARNGKQLPAGLIPPLINPSSATPNARTNADARANLNARSNPNARSAAASNGLRANANGGGATPIKPINWTDPANPAAAAGAGANNAAAQQAKHNASLDDVAANGAIPTQLAFFTDEALNDLGFKPVQPRIGETYGQMIDRLGGAFWSKLNQRQMDYYWFRFKQESAETKERQAKSSGSWAGIKLSKLEEQYLDARDEYRRRKQIQRNQLLQAGGGTNAGGVDASSRRQPAAGNLASAELTSPWAPSGQQVSADARIPQMTNPIDPRYSRTGSAAALLGNDPNRVYPNGAAGNRTNPDYQTGGNRQGTDALDPRANAAMYRDGRLQGPANDPRYGDQYGRRDLYQNANFDPNAASRRGTGLTEYPARPDPAGYTTQEIIEMRAKKLADEKEQERLKKEQEQRDQEARFEKMLQRATGGKAREAADAEGGTVEGASNAGLRNAVDNGRDLAEKNPGNQIISWALLLSFVVNGYLLFNMVQSSRKYRETIGALRQDAVHAVPES